MSTSVRIRHVCRPAVRTALLVGLALSLPASARAQQAGPPPDRTDLDDKAFLDALRRYGMMELEDQFNKDRAPEAAPKDLVGLVKKLDALRAVAADARRPPADRNEARKQMVLVLDRLVDSFPADARIHTWRSELADLMLEVEINPYSKPIIYEVTNPTNLQSMGQLLDRAEQLVSACEREVPPRLAQLEQLPDDQFRQRAAEYDRLDEIKSRLPYYRAVLDFYRAQWAWAKGARVSQNSALSPLLGRAAVSVPAFFAQFVARKEVGARVGALKFLGWTALLTDAFDQAIARADLIINDDTAAPADRFEAYILKSSALRGQLKFDEASKVLADLAKFVAATPALSAPMWRAFVVLGQANILIERAIQSGRVKDQEARNQRKQGNTLQAEKLESEISADYFKARAAADKLLEETAQADPPAAGLLNDFRRGLLKQWDRFAASTSQPDEPPPADELAKMEFFQLRTMAESAQAARHYAVAAACWGELARRADANPPADPAVAAQQKGEVLVALAKALYFQAQEAERRSADPDAKKAALAVYAEAIKAFNRVRAETPKAQPEADTLKFLASALLKLPDVYSDPAFRDQLVGVLERLVVLMADTPEAQDYMYFLGEAYYRAGKYREAINAYARVGEKNPSYDEAREYACVSVLKFYEDDARTRSADAVAKTRDLDLLKGFADYAVKRAPELRGQADRLAAEAAAASGPAEKAAKLEKAEQLRDRARRIEDRGADFEVEVGRLYWAALKEARRASDVLTAAMTRHKDRQDIRGRALRYLVQVYMEQEQFDQALKLLLELIKVDPSRAGPLVIQALGGVEESHNALRAAQKDAEARAKAVQAEQLARTLVEQAKNEKGLPPDVLVDFKVRLGRTLNWLDRHAEALALLEPLYVAPRKMDFNKDGVIDDRDVDLEATGDPDLIIELADAYFDTGKTREALLLYNQVSQARGEKLLYGELWWRGLIGQCHCNLLLHEALPGSYQALVKSRAAAIERDRTSDIGSKVSFDVPGWLLPRYNEVLEGLKTTPEVQEYLAKEREGGRKAAEEKPEPPPESRGREVLALFAIGAGGVVFLVATFLVLLRKQKRQSAAEA